MKHRIFFLLFVVFSALLLAAACAAPTPPPAQVVERTVVVPQTKIVETTKVVEQTKVVEKVITPTPPANPEALIDGVEANAEITFWTYWLSPNFDDYIKSTIARFQQAYPTVKVNWEDHQKTFLDDYRNAIAAGKQPDVANLSDNEGWVSEFATKGVLLNLDDNVSQKVKDVYFPGLWKQNLVGGKNYQFPWYQAIAVELINTQIYSEKNGFKVADFPKTFDGIPALCKSIKDKTNTLCDIRLTVNDLFADMTYQGGVKVVSEDGKKFTFNSPEGVAWLQLYVDMVKAGTVDRTALVTDQDRVALELFTSGKAAFFQTGPQLIRDVRSNNPGLYGYLAVVPFPVGKSGVVAPTSMALSVRKDSKFPKASIALAQFFTNPKSMLEFSKVVSIYPSTPASYDDPFFSAKPVAIEDSAKPLAKEIIAKQADIKPTIPKFKDANDILLQAVQQALFNNVTAQKALDDAVTQCNVLISK